MSPGGTAFLIIRLDVLDVLDVLHGWLRFQRRKAQAHHGVGLRPSWGFLGEVGTFKKKMHRKITGTPKSCKKMSNFTWFCIILHVYLFGGCYTIPSNCGASHSALGWFSGPMLAGRMQKRIEVNSGEKYWKRVQMSKIQWYTSHNTFQMHGGVLKWGYPKSLRIFHDDPAIRVPHDHEPPRGLTPARAPTVEADLEAVKAYSIHPWGFHGSCEGGVSLEIFCKLNSPFTYLPAQSCMA